LKSRLHLAILAALSISPTVGFSQKLVDPSKVAPEYREAAEKRRAEQMVRANCAKKADWEKVKTRDISIFINRCVEDASK
jgi:hypothetical protein